MNEKKAFKILACVAGVAVVAYLLLITVFSETWDYWGAIHKNTV